MEYPTDRKISLFSAFALSKASGPQGYQSTGFVACWSRYGDCSRASRFLFSVDIFRMGRSSYLRPSDNDLIGKRQPEEKIINNLCIHFDCEIVINKVIVRRDFFNVVEHWLTSGVFEATQFSCLHLWRVFGVKGQHENCANRHSIEITFWLRFATRGFARHDSYSCAEFTVLHNQHAKCGRRVILLNFYAKSESIEHYFDRDFIWQARDVNSQFTNWFVITYFINLYFIS